MGIFLAGNVTSHYLLIEVMRPIRGIQNVFQYSSVVVAPLLYSLDCSKWRQTKEKARYVYLFVFLTISKRLLFLVKGKFHVPVAERVRSQKSAVV